MKNETEQISLNDFARKLETLGILIATQRKTEDEQIKALDQANRSSTEIGMLFGIPSATVRTKIFYSKKKKAKK